VNINEAFPSKYISATDLQGRSARVRIDRVAIATMNDGKSKPILYFQGKQKGLALNKTNANTIQNTYGPDTDDWAGAEIELFPAEVDFQGKMVQAVRVRIPPRQAARPTQPAQQRQAAPAQTAPQNEPPFDDDIPF
jgi:hypothetical protein